MENRKYLRQEMEGNDKISESVIVTGSDINYRTFKDDESWTSLQSTILAGQFSVHEDSEIIEKKDLTTVTEEVLISSKDDFEQEVMDEEENFLNMNLDAISDDEVFFDCESYVSPKPSKKFISPERSENIKVSSNQFLSPDNLNTYSYDLTSDSELGEERTGELLLHIVQDFNNIKDNDQSTPKQENEFTYSTDLSSKLTNTNNDKNNNSREQSNNLRNGNCTTETNISKRTLDFSSAKIIEENNSSTYRLDSPDDKANKENFFKGKYSSAVHLARGNSKFKSPADMKSRKFAQIKEFFENGSKVYDQSCSRNIKKGVNIGKTTFKSSLNSSKTNLKLKNTPINTYVNKYKSKTTLHLPTSMQLKDETSKSLCHSPQRTIKLMKNKRALTINSKYSGTFNSSGNSSFLSRNEPMNSKRSLRSCSCSDACESLQYQSSVDTSVSLINKSKSTSDLSVEVSKINKIKKKPLVTHLGNELTTLHTKNSNTSSKSKIMKRKSIGFISSPVIPVKELRKMFSPSSFNSNQRKQKSSQLIKTIPQIIIS